MTAIEKQRYRLILSRQREVERILKAASRDLAKTITPFKTYNKPLKRKIDNILRELHNDIQTSIENGIRTSWDGANKMNDAIVGNYVKGVDVPGGLMASMQQVNLDALEAFISRTEKGFTLSKRIWKYTDDLKKQINLYMGSGITTGKSAAQISRDLRRHIPQLMKDPNRLYRRVRVEVKDKITGEVKKKLVLSEAAKAYKPGSGVYRSSYKNALRLAANETNMAYHISDFNRRQQLPFIVGIEVKLSAAHPRPDICDSMTGRYPKGFYFTGWHPLCMCYTTSIRLKKDEFIKFVKTGAIDQRKYIRSIPQKAQGYLQRNKAKLLKLKSKPYWMQNFTQDLRLKKSVKKAI